MRSRGGTHPEDDSEARAVLARLVERGLVEALGESGPVYHLERCLYARIVMPKPRSGAGH